MTANKDNAKTLEEHIALPTTQFEILQAQLTHLNDRSRFYTAQLWQVPFAYIFLTAIIVRIFVDQPANWLRAALFFCGILGGMTIWHLLRMRSGEMRAVEHLVKFEAKLSKKPEKDPNFETAELGHSSLALFWMVVFVAALYILSGVAFIWDPSLIPVQSTAAPGISTCETDIAD